MTRRELLLTPAAAAAASAQTGGWVEKAERLKPRLDVTPVPVRAVVKPIADPSAFLRWRMEKTGSGTAVSDRVMRRGDSVVVDFGRHLTGHLQLAIAGEGRGVDAPARLKFTFGEVPAEVAEPFDPYKGGLSRAWLQDEVINIDVLPSTVRLPRRYAFRYLKIDVIDTSPNFGVRLRDMSAEALSSAGRDPEPLRAAEDLRRIDEVSVATLRDCMQTVFEDGPKRDRRLWIGDLRLQALANYATYRDLDLVKRCLYLFAGLPREDGFVAACVFEEPKPLRGHEYIIDYAALYASTVLDYAKASGDWATAQELWPVVQRQMEILSGYVGADGLFAAPRNSWVFIDWNNRLDRTAAMHGVFTYTLGHAAELARRIGDNAAASRYGDLAARMRESARGAFFDGAQGVFVSGPARQVSWASQAWMTLSGIATPSEAAAALRRVSKSAAAVKPGGPYLYHYVVDAMLSCGLKNEALDLIRSYWGGMVKDGADTFWEVYDPADPNLSPYGNVLVNSYCHAWSCTPTYFLRARGLVA